MEYGAVSRVPANLAKNALVGATTAPSGPEDDDTPDRSAASEGSAITAAVQKAVRSITPEEYELLGRRGGVPSAVVNP